MATRFGTRDSVNHDVACGYLFSLSLFRKLLLLDLHLACQVLIHCLELLVELVGADKFFLQANNFLLLGLELSLKFLKVIAVVFLRLFLLLGLFI